MCLVKNSNISNPAGHIWTANTYVLYSRGLSSSIFTSVFLSPFFKCISLSSTTINLHNILIVVD